MLRIRYVHFSPFPLRGGQALPTYNTELELPMREDLVVKTHTPPV